jgi:hypothetical protein
MQGIIFKKIIDTSKKMKKIFVQVEKVFQPPITFLMVHPLLMTLLFVNDIIFWNDINDFY